MFYQLNRLLGNTAGFERSEEGKSELEIGVMGITHYHTSHQTNV